MEEKIYGERIVLRPATMDDRKPIFDWLTNSDLTKFMIGPPDYPDHPIPGWEEFLNDYPEYFFDGSKPLSGRCFIIELEGEAIGQINYDVISKDDKSTYLDIWLKSSKYSKKGYGTEAIEILCKYLADEFSCQRILIAPSMRNVPAIRAYEKAGFAKTDIKLDASLCDYEDTIVLEKNIK